MAESLICVVLDQLISITTQQAAQPLKLVTGIHKQVDNLTSNLQAIKAVIEDAEEKQLKDKAVKNWLEKLKEVSYEIDDVLDEWKTSILKQQIQQEETEGRDHIPLLKKVWCFSTLSSCLCFRQIVLCHETALKIAKLNRRLVGIANERRRYNFTTERSSRHEQRNITTSVIDESEVFVREEDKKAIKDMLLLCESREEKHALRIVSVVGMGGIGKTTLARLVYNDAQVESHFEKRIWVCVSDPFDEERISVEILESLLGEKPNLVGKNNIQQRISELVSGKKILLVLDDVWTEDSSQWEQLKGSLKNSCSGTRILLTTRKNMVGKVMGSRSSDMFLLRELSEDKCWSLFCHLAFFERTIEECKNLEDIGREVVERCKGLPLAVKTLGGLLRFKPKEQWASILDNKTWEIEEVEKAVFPPLLLSYYDLPPVLRRCFSYCAVFPKDCQIEKDKLIKLWMAQGFVKETADKGMEIAAEEYFNKLAMRSFFQDFDKDGGEKIKYCKMHDIVHDFAQFLSEKECMLIEIDGVKEPWKDPCLKTIRHSMLVFERVGGKISIPMDNWKHLRSLLTNSDFVGDSTSSRGKNLLNSAIDQLTCLRALDLNEYPYVGGITKVPDKIGKLVHLRYLNLSRSSSLEILPEAICNLHNLQTLDISFCISLAELPRGIENLISLKYVENDLTRSLRFLPEGMERLPRLRTLKEFVVSNNSTGMRFQGLRKLSQLQGELKIKRLGNVANTGGEKEEALVLSALIGLLRLTLEFDSDEEMQPMREESEAFVVEALQPPPNLETLEISLLEGPTLFPNWLMSLTKLKSVTLSKCANWESLPPMGKLPFLEHLRIHVLPQLKQVGEEFLGIDREDNNNIAFPNLKSLRFEYMGKWEEWEYDEETSSNCSIIIPRRLDYLLIDKCPKLKAVPRNLLQNTQELRIRGCPILKERFQKGTGEDWHNISHIPTITIDYIKLQTDGH